MMYQVLGAVLEDAGRQLSAPGTDRHVALQRRRVQVLLTRVGRSFPAMFASLADENAILTSLADRLVADLRHHDVPVEPLGSIGDDPLVRNTTVHRVLDRIAQVLHEHPEPWAVAARRELRRGLLDAARVQQSLVARGFAGSDRSYGGAS